jgi:hypothetical protein
MALIDNFPRSAHAIAKSDLDKILIMDRDLRYKLLWAFTKTLSKRLRETSEKMAGFPRYQEGFNVFSIVRAEAEWYSDTAAVTALI